MRRRKVWIEEEESFELGRGKFSDRAFLRSFVEEVLVTVASILRANYAFKPTAEQALSIDRSFAGRGGLTRR